MGYYTRYSLNWNSDNDDAEQCAAIGDVIQNFSEFGWALNRDGRTKDSCKWYDHDDDMKALSRRFPEVLFTLSGDGEESGDIWKKYFLDGKMQVAKAVLDFPKFNVKLLK